MSIMGFARRPLSSILIAQHVVMPQMIISGLVAAAHTGFCWLLIGWWQLGPLGAALALNLASLLTMLCTGSYVVASGQQDHVWGAPSGAAFRVRLEP